MKAPQPPRRLLLVAASVLAVLLVATATRQTSDWVEKVQVQNGQEFLKALRNTTSEAIRVWKEEEMHSLEYLASTPEVQAAATQLVRDSELGVAPSQSDGLTNVRDWYQGIPGGHFYEGFFVVGPGNTNLASSRDENLGEANLLTNRGTLLVNAWNGGTFCSSPIRSNVELPMSDGRLVEGRATMFAGTGIRNDADEIIALLLVRINPYDTLFQLLERSRPGLTGETVLFNGLGEIASHSRFLSSYHERADGKVISFFASNGLSSAQRHIILQPLINAKRSGPASRFSTMTPYLNYSGKPVVGAWEWNEDIQMGMLVEMSEEEAFQSIWATRKALSVFGIIAGAAIFLVMLGHQLWIIKEKERRQRLEREMELNHLKSEFLARMSHEIRTPMNGVFGMLECLAETQLSNEQADRVHTALDSASSMLAILNDILDLSKIESGQIEFIEEEFSLKKAVDGAILLFEDKAKMQNNKMRLDWDEQLPVRHIGDSVRIIQILTNLLSNANKFTDDGTIVVKALVGGEEDTVRIEVVDSGVGIPENRINAIFSEFVQADATTSRYYGGTGLGLAIVSRLVRGMGGEVSVHSTVGVGSTFSFTLPLKVAAQAAERPDQQLVSATPTIKKVEDVDLTGIRALVVDDNKVNLKVARAFLRKLNCEVTLAEGGQESVDLVREQKFDLVFMDIQMPDVDGFEATQAIRELANGKDSFIIALTAHAMPEYRQKCTQAGMDAFLAKPMRKKALADLLRESFLPTLNNDCGACIPWDAGSNKPGEADTRQDAA